METQGVTRTSSSCRILCAASWVDNIYSVSNTLLHAIWILEDFALQLGELWGLRIKDSSRTCMVALGSDEVPPDPARWKLVSTFECLGHRLQQDGSIMDCWQATQAAMWRAFWGNSANSEVSRLPLCTRVRLLDRAVVPPFLYRCSRWPPQQQVKLQIDRLQRKMLAILLHIRPAAGESVEQYCRRRGRIAKVHSVKMGLWSRRWFQRAVNWNNHLMRARNSHLWSHWLLLWRDQRWLQARRLDMGSSSCLGGRTGTRTFRGKPMPRWHDGIELASRDQ